MSQAELPNPPNDVITAISFSPVENAQHLLATSIGGEVRLYDCSRDADQSLLLGPSVAGKGILDACWGSHDTAYVGNVDGTIRKMVFGKNDYSVIGSLHNYGVSCIRSIGNCVIAGSWDKSLQCVDLRSDRSESISLPGKVFAMDVTDNCVVLGLSGRKTVIYDVRNLSSPMLTKESGLKYQTRDIKCMPDGKGYAHSALEGRVAVEFFDPSPQVQAQSYAFKCHRASTPVLDVVYPVNALCFHPVHGTLFTGGSDSHVCMWDPYLKKRLKQYPKIDQSELLGVMGIDIKASSNTVAIAASDDGFRNMASPDDVEHSRPVASSKVIVKRLGENEGVTKRRR